jgi:hypothetical protein
LIDKLDEQDVAELNAAIPALLRLVQLVSDS